MLVKNDTPVLLATNEAEVLGEQTTIDQTAIATIVSTPEQCKQITYTEKELEANLKKAVSSNEDVGRYVGYGWKEIIKG